MTKSDWQAIEPHVAVTNASMAYAAMAGAPRGHRQRLADLLWAVAQTRQQRGQMHRAAPTIRQQILRARQRRMGTMIRAHGPVPAKSGAGTLVEDVVLEIGRHTPTTSVEVEYGDRYSRRCKYSMRNHTVTHHLPATCEMRVVAGVVTIARQSAWSAAPGSPIACWWPEKSRGYGCRWVAGWLLGRTHMQAASADAAARRYARIRDRQARNRLAAMRAAHVSRRGADARWLTWADAKSAGNCDSGITQAAQRLAAACGVSLDDLRAGVALRLDVVRQAVPDLAYYVTSTSHAAAAAGH